MPRARKLSEDEMQRQLFLLAMKRRLGEKYNDQMIKAPPSTDPGIYKLDALTAGWPYHYGIRGRGL